MSPSELFGLYFTIASAVAVPNLGPPLSFDDASRGGRQLDSWLLCALAAVRAGRCFDRGLSQSPAMRTAPAASSELASDLMPAETAPQRAADRWQPYESTEDQEDPNHHGYPIPNHRANDRSRTEEHNHPDQESREPWISHVSPLPNVSCVTLINARTCGNA